MRVPLEALPEVEETATPFGLTSEQHAKLKEMWYERGHYSSRDRMWKLLQDQAREDGELQERTVNRKDGPVTVATPYGIRYRQLGQWIRAQESMQLFKRPATVKTYRSFIYSEVYDSECRAQGIATPHRYVQLLPRVTIRKGRVG